MDRKRKQLTIVAVGLALFFVGLLGWFADAWLGGCPSRGISPYEACAGAYPVDPIVFVAALVIGAVVFGAARFVGPWRPLGR